MYRRTFVLIVSIVVSRTTVAQLLQQENVVNYNLNGKVKSFTESPITKEVIVGAANLNTKRIVSFNHDGNISKLELYTGAELTTIREYTYSGIGYSCISKSKQKVKGVDTWIATTPRIYNYNDKKHIEETKGGNEPTNVGYYDDKGETDSIFLYTPSGNLIQKIYHLYNQAGHITETTIFKSDGALAEHYTYKLDVEGRKILEQSFDAMRSVKYVRSHKYDQYGNESEFHESAAVDNNVDGKFNTKVRTFTYRYDNLNNWISREEFSDDGKLINVTERKITYY